VVVWQDGDSSSQKSVEKVFGAEPRRAISSVGVMLEGLMRTI